jgi:hypothetical protein
MKNNAQFDKGMGTILWSVWYNGVDHSVMSELKQNRISSLKSLIIARPMEY